MDFCCITLYKLFTHNPIYPKPCSPVERQVDRQFDAQINQLQLAPSLQDCWRKLVLGRVLLSTLINWTALELLAQNTVPDHPQEAYWQKLAEPTTNPILVTLYVRLVRNQWAPTSLILLPWFQKDKVTVHHLPQL